MNGCRDYDGCIIGEKPPVVDSGTYEFVYEYHETAKLYGGRALKLVLWLRITSLGEYFDVKLPRYYNVRNIISRKGKNGSFRVGWKSNFAREFTLLFGFPQRLDRIPMTRFKNVCIEARVRQVTHDAKHRLIPDGLQYSVVDELLGLKTP